MYRRQFGSTDMVVSPLGFGAAEIGFGDVAGDLVGKMLNKALDLGINVIDTAECYANSEGKIGEAVSHRRDEFYLFTKCGHSSGFDAPDWDVAMLERSIDRSLERLKTDYVDLIQLHSCSKELLEHGEVIEVLERAKAAGKTRYIGYSGENEGAIYACECGRFDTLQTSVNFAEQRGIDLVLPKAREAGMGVIAKRPVANVAWRHDSYEVAGYGAEYWRRLQSLKYEFEDMVATALRFTLSQSVDVAIVGASKPERIAANIAIVEEGDLPADLLQAIRGRWRMVSQPDWVGQV